MPCGGRDASRTGRIAQAPANQRLRHLRPAAIHLDRLQTGHPRSEGRGRARGQDDPDRLRWRSCWRSSCRPSLATLGFAWWFRASNTRAQLPAGLGLFRAHRADRLGDPAAGRSCCWAASPGSARTSSTRRSRCASDDAAARGPGRVARLEMAVHLPGPGRRERQPAGDPGRRAGPFLADLGQRDERVLRPAARQHDLHDERHGDAAEPAGRPARAPSTACRAITAATASPTCISRCARVPAEQFAAWVDGRAGSGPTLDAASYAAAGAAEHRRRAVHLPRRRARPVRADRHAASCRPARARRPAAPDRDVSPRTEH